jgi:SAM-dependent methyltransferase
MTVRQASKPGRNARQTDANTLVERSIRAYGNRALAYYTGYHPTSRYFDHLIHSYLVREPLPIMPGSRWLEVGSGHGRLSEYGRRDSFRRCYIDSSRVMLEQHDDTAGLWVVGSALNLPFRDASFNGLASFLGDAYTTEEYFAEAHRVLSPHGHFIHVVPTAIWGHTLRMRRKRRTDEAQFVDRAGNRIRAPSILHDRETLLSMGRRAGFRMIAINELTPQSDTPAAGLPKDVHTVVAALKLEMSTLPVLAVIRAER